MMIQLQCKNRMIRWLLNTVNQQQIEIYNLWRMDIQKYIFLWVLNASKTYVIITLLSYYIHAIFFLQKSFLPRIFVSSSKQVVMLFKLDWKCIALKNLFTYHKVVTLSKLMFGGNLKWFFIDSKIWLWY